VQSASTGQSAQSSVVSTQTAVNAGSGGSAHQSNTSSASSGASNTNSTDQHSSQSQTAGDGGHPDSAGGSGQAQATRQDAPTEQNADAQAASTQVAPTNVNIVVRVDSPGNDGPVTQTNSSVADATGSNANHVVQAADQSQIAGGPGTGQTQDTSQSAPTTQQSTGSAASTQVNPMNVNIVVRNKSPGDEGPVSQSNSSQATAVAANTNAVDQAASQAQAAGDVASGQAQSVTQDASISQAAGASSTSAQVDATNAGIDVRLDPAAPDPNGSGALGSLIQIWIPTQTVSSPADDSISTAVATNSNTIGQAADQTQTAAPAGPTLSGGSGQTQIVSQNAPTTQTAGASATSAQSGGDVGSSSATATAVDANTVSQAADQTQTGGSGGSQVQVIVQQAPADETATAIATATGGWTESTATQSSSGGATQQATQTQSGGGSQVQVIEQTSTADDSVRPVGRSGRPHHPEAAVKGADGIASPYARSSGGWSEGGSSGHRTGSGPAPSRRHVGPQLPRPPLPPQAPSSAGSGAGSGGGGSLLLFAAVLLPFVLTAPWWARRQRPSAVRRLMGVVSRLERPG
jgi:hypothetical protein